MENKRILINILNSALWLLVAFTWAGCGAYSFTGTSLPPDVKSITIPTFPNASGGGPATLSQTFSERVRDYFQRNTSLSLTPQGGDLTLEGQIVGYELTPLPASSQDVASQMRLTIRVKATYVNLKDETQNFDDNFSFYYDFSSSASLTSVEPAAIDAITEQIIIQMFNRSVANW